MTSVIDKIVEQARSIAKSEHPTIAPGQPARFIETWDEGDGLPQGDLNIYLYKGIPENYRKVENPTEADKQLVPGNTLGSKHCLDSLDGVEIWRHDEWGPNYWGLWGPLLVVTKERTSLHPRHGDVTLIPFEELNYMCGYQENLSEQEATQRRVQD